MSASYSHHLGPHTEVHTSDLGSFKTVVLRDVTVGRYYDDGPEWRTTIATTTLLVQSEDSARIAAALRDAADFLDPR